VHAFVCIWRGGIHDAPRWLLVSASYLACILPASANSLTHDATDPSGPEPLRLCAAVITAGTVRALLDDVEDQLANEFPPR
jgi:hypothetical protein